MAQLALNGDLDLPADLDSLTGDGDVLLQRLGGCVNHHAGHALAQGANDLADTGAVIQMENGGGCG